MSEVKKIATREAYGNALAEFGENYPDLYVLDADLAAATKTSVFKKKYPDRHIDCGIAEANMMGIAAGLSLTGAIPVASYVGEDGASHQCNEDIALMRSIPGMTILSPSDAVEARACVKAALDIKGPVYMRFGRAAVPVINDRPDYRFEIGKGEIVREGTDVTIVATGIMVNSALEAAEMLAEEGIRAEVINICTIKPLDVELIVKSVKKTGKVVTAEEHSVIGGLGGAVCEALSEAYPVPVYRIGVRDVFGESGSAAALLEKYELDGKGVYRQVKNFIITRRNEP
ncbi:MAG: transketolase family protein [Lachnospiraceae bacterium]|nr:transketolase family protein [Lachnospiraceae bacterium]